MAAFLPVDLQADWQLTARLALKRLSFVYIIRRTICVQMGCCSVCG